VKGWEPVPSALIGDTDLSLQARAVYVVLRNLIWHETKANEDVMSAEIGTLDDLARAAGCGRTPMKQYLAELRDAGWISSARLRRGHPFTYTVFSAPTRSESDPVEHPEAEATRSESGPVQGRNPALWSDRALLVSNKNQTEEANASSSEVEIANFLDEKFGVAPPGTNAGGKRLKAIADLRALGATADSLKHAFHSAEYGERRWAVKTDIALATHFPTLTRGYTPSSAEAAEKRPALVFWGERPGETSEQAYERWVREQAAEPHLPLNDIYEVIDGWRDIDDVAREELAALAEQIRGPLVAGAIARSLDLKEDAAA